MQLIVQQPPSQAIPSIILAWWPLHLPHLLLQMHCGSTEICGVSISEVDEWLNQPNPLFKFPKHKMENESCELLVEWVLASLQWILWPCVLQHVHYGDEYRTNRECLKRWVSVHFPWDSNKDTSGEIRAINSTFIVRNCLLPMFQWLLSLKSYIQ